MGLFSNGRVWPYTPKDFFVSARHLTPNDVYDFTEAAGHRRRHPERPQTQERSILEFMGWLNKYQKIRWWRMRSDMKWYLKQAQKHGIDPDTARKLI